MRIQTFSDLLCLWRWLKAILQSNNLANTAWLLLINIIFSWSCEKPMTSLVFYNGADFQPFIPSWFLFALGTHGVVCTSPDVLPMIKLILCVILAAPQYPAVQPNTDEGTVVKILSREGSIYNQLCLVQIPWMMWVCRFYPSENGKKKSCSELVMRDLASELQCCLLAFPAHQSAL